MTTRPPPRPWSRPWASTATSATGAARPRRSTRAGTLYRVCGDPAQAEGCHQQALDLARAIASSWDEAHALAGLGRCALAAGHAARPRACLRQALEIFERIGAAEAPACSPSWTPSPAYHRRRVTGLPGTLASQR